MKREDLARQLSQKTRLSRAAARDQVDEAVRNILEALRQGKPAELPGIGRLIPRPNSRKSAGK